jgi:hypothetical protein
LLGEEYPTIKAVGGDVEEGREGLSKERKVG